MTSSTIAVVSHRRTLMKRSFVFASLLLLAATAIAIELPRAPAGFSWKELPEIKAAFLIPDGWFFKREETKGTLGYFITREKIDGRGGRFDTGLSLFVMRQHRGGPAVTYARAFIETAAAKHDSEVFEKEAGPFRGFGTQFTSENPGGSVTVHQLMIANPKTNTLYLVIFESPALLWQRQWETGEKILKLFLIDDEV